MTESDHPNGDGEQSDLDITDLLSGWSEAEDKIRNHFKATEATIDSSIHKGDVAIRLEFRGFTSLVTAIDKMAEVSRRLDALGPDVRVHAGVDTSGAYDPNNETHDDRPAAWVNADFDLGGDWEAGPGIKNT